MSVDVQIERVIRVDAPGIGAKIKAARERDPRSVEDLAKAADMTRANWYRIEREDNDVLPETTLRKIEGILGTDFGVQFEAGIPSRIPGMPAPLPGVSTRSIPGLPKPNVPGSPDANTFKPGSYIGSTPVRDIEDQDLDIENSPAGNTGDPK